FLTSRRRHTSCYRDWSSDVCSSDLWPLPMSSTSHVEELFRTLRARGATCEVLDIGKGQLPAQGVIPAGGLPRFSALLVSRAASGYRVHVHTSGANAKSWMLAQACAAAGRLSGGALLT